MCNWVVASVIVATASPLAAQDAAADVDALLEELADPDTTTARQIERRLRLEWSKSGSPAMDLLLQRAQKAMEDEKWERAYEHLTALTDHAPDFAEGWHLRATVLFRQKRYGQALEDLQRTLALNAHHFNALAGLAVILEDVGLPEQALEVWRRVLEINPHNEEMRESLDRLERSHGGVPI